MTFETVSIKRVENGFIVQIDSGDDITEYVYDSSRKVIKTVRELIELKKEPQ